MTTQDSIVVVCDPTTKNKQTNQPTNKKFITAKDFDSENNK